MASNNIKLTRRKVLASIGAVGAAGAGAGMGTSAIFTDEESFENNSLVAGTLDLKVSWDEHYFNGIRNLDDVSDADVGFVDSVGDGSTGFPSSSESPYLAVADDEVDAFMDDTRTEQFPEGGLGPEEDPCEELADVPEDLPAPVIDLDDVKPGDFGEVTFDFSLCDNPGYLWMTGSLVDEGERGVNEPESGADGENDTPTSALLPLAALAAVPALDDPDGESDEGDNGGGRSLLRRGAAAAGMGAAGLSALSGTASADEKGEPADPDGNLDVQTSNSTLDVTVGERSSDTFLFDGTDTLYDERYGFRDGTSGTHVDSTVSGTSITDPFPSSVAAGTTASATIEFPVPTANGTTVDLEVVRKVTLDSTDPTLRVEYEITNPSGSGGTFDDLRFSQHVDYDIAGIDTDVGRYFEDPNTGCEFIWQETTDANIFAGFTAEKPSVGHHLTNYSAGISNFTSDSPTFNNEPEYPVQDTTDSDLETDDVELTFEWSLGSLAPGETTTFRTSFVYNDQGQEEFERQICQESPGTPTPSPTPTPTPSQGESELPDKVQARVWYDDGDNVHEDDEQVIVEGTLRQVLSRLSTGKGLPLDGDESTNTDFDETGGSPTDTARDCYAAADEIHYLGFEWWVPREVGNEIQTDSASFDLGFYAEQCRSNDGDSGRTETTTEQT